jgi:hypothetical protein
MFRFEINIPLKKSVDKRAEPNAIENKGKSS